MAVSVFKLDRVVCLTDTEVPEKPPGSMFMLKEERFYSTSKMDAPFSRELSVPLHHAAQRSVT